MSQYYVISPDGRRFGPADFQTLSQWAGEGRVAPGMMVEDTLNGQTMTASAVPGLFPQGGQPQYASYVRPGYTPTRGGAHATTAMVLGIVSLVLWCIPILGLPLAITAIVFGAKNLNSEERTKAMVGLLLGIVGLLLCLGSIVFAALISQAFS